MIASVSVDLDGLSCYAAIHGLPREPSEAQARLIPVAALGRLCEVFAQAGVAATLFAVGRDLDQVAGAAAAVAQAAREGHELASHSHRHDYALSRRSAGQIESDLAEAELAIERATGRLPRGFRAPGYQLSGPLLAALRARGYAYDSSLLPSATYGLAKHAVLIAQRVRGRRSQSLWGGAGLWWRSRGPHRLVGLRELPISTLPWLRLPAIGTSLLALPRAVAARALLASTAGGFVQLELHGIDALDATDVPWLAGLQPGLSIPAGEKLGRLAALLRALRDGAELRTLEGAAAALLPGD